MNPLVVVGAGPIGMRCTQELLTKKSELNVKVFGKESCQPYNRVR